MLIFIGRHIGFAILNFVILISNSLSTKYTYTFRLNLILRVTLRVTSERYQNIVDVTIRVLSIVTLFLHAKKSCFLRCPFNSIVLLENYSCPGIVSQAFVSKIHSRYIPYYNNGN